ncbi:hypothetical protein NEISICOT_02882 [Neisseria sicca ATCC 29256]|uniref:Uncharacterized protein n=1 Tax=Neisseria sicca ATCC 29256 TaxID=547045 RepID=C6M8K8_NEISI|nr:hypothetical protein NEISICOT_02882 [Neisseria sicca ATCC 29256]
MAAAHFHVEVAGVAVFVDGGVFQTVGQVKQGFAGVDDVQAGGAPAACRGVEHGAFDGIDGGNGVACGVADGGGAEQRDDEVVAVFPAPCGEGVAEGVFVVGNAACACDVNQAAESEGGVDADADEVFAGAFDIEAQDVAAEADDVAQVVEEVAHAGADGLGRYFAVAACDGGEDVLVGLVVEFEDGAVVAFVGVGGVVLGKCGG